MPKAPLPKRLRIQKKDLKGFPAIRIGHHPEKKLRGRARRGAHYVLRCGHCPTKVEIYYDSDFLEINGVEGSIKNWRRILLPLLGINPKTLREKDLAMAMCELRRLRRKYPIEKLLRR